MLSLKLFATLTVMLLSVSGFVAAQETTDSSEVNAEIIRRMITEVWKEGNLQNISEFYAPVFTWHSPVGWDAPEGMDKFALSPAEWQEIATASYLGYVSLSFFQESVVAENDLVFFHYYVEAWSEHDMNSTWRHNTGTFWSGVFVYRLENGKIVEEQWYWDRPCKVSEA